VDFLLNLSFDYANGGQRGSMPLQQHATLRRTPSGWQILSIR
jgi:hypothetical protein